MSYGRYGGGAGADNPYARRREEELPYPTGSSYTREPQYNAPPMGGDYNGQNVEMAPLAQNGSQFGRQQDPNTILNTCREVDKGIQEIRNLMRDMQTLQGASLTDTTGTKTGDRIESQGVLILNLYKELTRQVKAIKQQPESGSPRNAPQVGKVDRALKKTYQEYMEMDRQFRQRSNEQSARQYRIVRPDASEQEVRQAVENPDSQQVFQQALMNSNRQGQAKSTLDAVKNRHAAIQEIERQMIQLAELFNDMDNLVMQQEAAVTNIEMKGEEVVENMDKGNAEIGTAIVHARNARKWKWWCLCICLLIVVIIAVGVVAWYFVAGPGATKNKTTTTTAAKRFILDSHRVISGQPWAQTKVQPVGAGVDWTGDSKRAVAFAA